MAVRPWLERFSDEVVTINERTSREIECTRILAKHPRSPVHFTDLDGYEAVGNLWSTRERVASAMNTTKDALLGHLMLAMSHSEDFRVVDKAGFQANETTDVNLLESPIPKIFPGNAGRYVTAGVWVAEWEGHRNLSFHRIQVLDAKRGACRIVPRHLHHMYQEALTAGQELKVAVCVGLDPWLLIGGGTSVEYGVDEMRIASCLKHRTLGSRVDAVKIRNGLTVPADAEYVLEGRLINERHAEGPFVDAVRTYDRVREEPILVLDRVYHRDDPAFHFSVGRLDEYFLVITMRREPSINQASPPAVPGVRAG